jgi:CubicO group peptidase (beta-lactamase class C family)
MRRPLALLAALVMSTRATAQSPEALVDSLMTPYAAPGQPGASVLVVQGGHVALAKGYGLAEVETGRPVTPTTNFRLASLSKQFTATAVMLLVAEGRLRYDDGIAALLPGLPAYARGVTVRHLLHHTSGLPDYERFVPDTQTAQVHDADVPPLIARDSALKFAPGTRYAYSNTGYALLALLVERVSGQRFGDFLRARLYAPSGMAGALAHEEGRTVVPERAYGYTVRGGAVRRTDQSNTSATLGDGGVYASAADLARWDAAIERHALVGAEAAWTPPALAGTPGGPFAGAGYGFGWFVDADRGTTRLRHHGQSRGFTNAIVRYPERRLTVVVLTNRTGGAPWEIAQRVADRLLSR